MSKKYIEIVVFNDNIILTYRPRDGTAWLDEKLKQDGRYELRNSLALCKDDLTTDAKFINNNDEYNFVIGKLRGDYYEVPERIFETKFPVLIHKNLEIDESILSLDTYFNIYKIIQEYSDEQIVIGGDAESTIPKNELEALISLYPTIAERKHYIAMRISNILRNYFSTKKEYGELYEKFINKKERKLNKISSIETIKEYECDKYVYILNKIKEMLSNANSYNEDYWRDQILEFILLIYPKYVGVIKQMKINDTIQDGHYKYIDIALIDANGNIDIIEIKKPQEGKSLLSKGTYRSNYVPSHELSGAIMQIEKYLYHLSRMGKRGEQDLTRRYANNGLSFKITKPKGIIIAGLSPSDETQKNDFEIIKRKYANIIDIITYNDLISRLENILVKYQH